MCYKNVRQAEDASVVQTVDLDRVVQAYTAIRDARSARKRVWEQEDAQLEAQQTTLRAFLLDHLNRTNTQSVRTTHGTAYRTEKLKPSAADWGAIERWIVDNDAFDLMERRLKATFIKQYMEDHDGAIPPGVNVHREFEVSVRRSNGASSTAAQETENE